MKRIDIQIQVSKLGKQKIWQFVKNCSIRSVVFSMLCLISNCSRHFSMTEILESLPKQRRTGLFSATQAKEMEEIVKFGLRLFISIIFFKSLGVG